MPLTNNDSSFLFNVLLRDQPGSIPQPLQKQLDPGKEPKRTGYQGEWPVSSSFSPVLITLGSISWPYFIVVSTDTLLCYSYTQLPLSPRILCIKQWHIKYIYLHCQEALWIVFIQLNWERTFVFYMCVSHTHRDTHTKICVVSVQVYMHM